MKLLGNFHKNLQSMLFDINQQDLKEYDVRLETDRIYLLIGLFIYP